MNIYIIISLGDYVRIFLPEFIFSKYSQIALLNGRISTVSPPYPQVLQPQIQPPQIQNIHFLIPEISKKGKLEFLCFSNYLHSISIVLGIINNLEMI